MTNGLQTRAFRGVTCAAALLIFIGVGTAQTPKLEVLYNFTNGTDGSAPMGGVVIGGDGVLYGTTFGGPTNQSNGTVFSLTPPASSGAAWTLSTLLNFNENFAFGTYPAGTLTIGTGGVLYGTNSTPPV